MSYGDYSLELSSTAWSHLATLYFELNEFTVPSKCTSGHAPLTDQR